MKRGARHCSGQAHGLAAVMLAAMACGFTGTLANAQNDDLVSAAKRGDLSAVNRLLQAGADVNQRKFVSVGGVGDATALMAASFNGSLDVVQTLLAAKADVNATLSEKKDGETALTMAVQKGHVEVVRALLAAKADVNATCCGANALYRATTLGNVEMVKVLLTAKPDLNRPGFSGRTALIQAISSGRLDIARLLMEAGPNVNTWTEQGVTALMLAAAENSPSSVAMVQALLDARAEPDFRLCLQSGNVGLPNYARTLGGTALGLASSTGSADAVRALLAAKADVNLAQCDGKTPLMLALENNRQEVAELLRGAGAAVPAEK